MSTIAAAPEPAVGILPARDRGGVFELVRRDRTLLAAVLILAAALLLALLGPLVWSADPRATELTDALSAPSGAHPMGTDNNGRDVLARFLAGGRISLAVGVGVALVGAVIGASAGLLAATRRGWVDFAVLRAMDSVLAFPPLILAMCVTVGLGAGVLTGAIGITLVSIPWYARLVRADALRIASLPFVEAAVALGASRRRVVRRHVLPHVLPGIAIQFAVVFGYAILAMAGLGFVGLGAKPPTPEWGTMITEGQQYALTGSWWIAVFPGLGLLMVIAASLTIADRVREILDPRRN